MTPKAVLDNTIRHVPVAVIGAGPTGITAATLLAQYGVDCLILDRWSQVYPQPRAVHLDDEVYRILARLGVADGFAAISRPTRGLRLLDADLAVLAEFQRDTARSLNGYPQANMFDQPALEELLRANLERYPHAQLVGDVEVIDVVPGDQVPTQITATSRTSGERLTITADYVLGCDGANSVVRGSIGARMRDLKFAQRWLVIDVATDADLGQWEGVHQVCDPRRAGTYMRIGPARYRWEFRLLPGESADDFGTLDQLRPLIAPWTDQVADRDLHVVRAAEYTFRAQIADRWRRGNVFLLGDAAHLTPPFIGQGMGAGLRDAMNLAWKLAGVLDGSLAEAVLDTYEIERKRHARQMIGLALNVGRAMTAGGRLGDALRHIIVPRLHLIPGLRARITDSRTPPLCRSALVHSSPISGRLAGRMCPNPLLRKGSHLDEELGTGFTILTSAGLTESQQRLIAERGAQVHLTEPGGALAEWLRRGRASAAIIRPDRTVMRAGRNLDTLCATLPALHPLAQARNTVKGKDSHR